ncbi:type VII secretion protein EssB [Bacillus sp. T33-2]|uniref:type VII secretion protein EssB n=1 Tax=Bacillus sp. T33-2 TaxID=2054168 RepID=UPI000C763865|nr:type VII secretion protein EssB [Bacillus sp. T33-2]PLR96523.1 type VII secretion protein EssB [Bacillus sp. T33-2]
MSDTKQTYLEQQLEAVISKENNNFTFTFQKGKIKLDDAVELEMLKEIEPSIYKEISLTEDEVTLNIQPPLNYISFSQLKKKDEQSKWVFASQLVKKVKEHSLTRLHLVVCPENIVFDESLTPYFLHYGLKESIPPYEKDSERLLKETKATVTAAVDEKFTFDQYIKFHETLQLSPLAASLLAAGNEDELLHLIQQNIKQLEEKEKTLVHIPQKKWKLTRYIALGLFMLFMPAFIYALYSLFFVQPKHAAFLNSQEHFLESEYSDVVNALADYDIDDMPKIVQYQLARSYIINESLTEEQKENVENAVTLQSDPLYFRYWILTGRGNAGEALDIARSLEDRDLILFGLLKYREEIKADDELTGEEKQQKLKEIESEIEEYMEEQKAKQEEEAELEKEKQDEESEAQPEDSSSEPPSEGSPEAQPGNGSTQPGQTQPSGQPAGTGQSGNAQPSEAGQQPAASSGSN